MTSWIEDRERSKKTLADQSLHREQFEKLRREKIVHESYCLAKSLLKRISQDVDEYNRTKASCPRLQIGKSVNETSIVLRGIVIEKPEELWFTVPTPVELSIIFDPLRANIFYSIPHRLEKGMYYELAPFGGVCLYDGSQIITEEKAATVILSCLLDITDPMPPLPRLG